MTAFRPLRLSPMHRAHLRAGARLCEDHGWLVPEAFTSPRDEEARARGGAGLADASAGLKLDVRGAAVDALMAGLTGGSAPTARSVGRLTLDGAEALACRRAPDELLVLAAAAAAETVEREVARAARAAGCAHVTDLSAGLAGIDLIGPAATRLLGRVSPLALAGVGPMELVHGQVARVPATVIRLLPAELPVFRVLVGREVGHFVWTALADAGHSLGVVTIGAAAHAALLGAGQGASVAH